MSRLPALPVSSTNRRRYPARRDTTIVTASRVVVIGADTHLDTIHLAALTDTGQPLADAEFPTRPAG